MMKADENVSIRKLQFVKKSLEKNQIEDKRYLIEILKEVENAIREDKQIFMAYYYEGYNNGHRQNYIKQIDKYKALAISNLEFIAVQIRGDEISLTPCLAMLNKMIESNFYHDDIQNFIDSSSEMHMEKNKGKQTELTVDEREFVKYW